MVKRAVDLGAEFEDKVQQGLKYLESFHRCAFERKYDTKSAGSYLPAQPSDFMAAFDGVHVLLECKASAVHTTFTRKHVTDNVGDKQVAGMRIWMRAGSNAFYLFHDVSTGIVELWPAAEIIHASITPRYTPDREKLITVCDCVPEIIAHMILNHCFKRSAT